MSGNEILTAGIDVGTGAVKAAVCASPSGAGAPMGAGARVLALVTERIHRRDPAAVADTCFASALAQAGVARGDLAYVASTGEGEAVRFCHGHFYGMTTHARGASFLVPDARAVLDVGALHSRVFAIDERSRVIRHRMTSQCASGTGQFLENIARYLGVRLEEVGPLSLAAARAESCSSICAVLAETDVINMVSRGVPTGELLRGIHDSIAGRLVKLLRAVSAESSAVVTGGLSRDVGLVGAIERRLAEEGVKLKVIAPEGAASAGALGAALWAAVRFERRAAAKAAGGPASDGDFVARAGATGYGGGGSSAQPVRRSLA